MPHVRLAFLGFGNVGKALVRLLQAKRRDLQERYDLTFSITGIATGRHGAAINPGGLDAERALTEPLETLSISPPPSSSLEFICRCGADVLFENTPVNYETGQPAVDYLRTALEQGMHAITANKGPVVHAYRELTRLAGEKNRRFYFESAVMDGAPIFSLFRETLPAARLIAFSGILNSTTNLILTRMEQGEEFERAVAFAQSAGLAETDPSGDIDGWDAAVKVAALVTVLMDRPLKPQQVERQGIRSITPRMVASALHEGKRWKLICTARRQEDGVSATVAPNLVDAASPFYGVSGASSVVNFEMDVLSGLTIVENDPGPETTAYGLLADLINAVKI